MMNVVAVFLVLSSLVTAGVWSPRPNHETGNIGGGNGDVILKEGHRVVVVEYDPDTDGNTKVLISPQDQTQVSYNAKEISSSVKDHVKGKAKETLDDAKGKVKEAFDQAKGKAKETASALHNLGQGKSGPIEPNGQGQQELVCGALGKCKHKIASAMGKAKDKASEAAHGMTEKAHEVEEQAKWKVSEAIGKTKDSISCKADEISSRAHKIEGRTEKAVDTSKTIGKDVVENLMSKIEAAKEKGERKMWKIFRRGGELIKDTWDYVVSLRFVGSTMGAVHLLGFATAYGMCVWVTFVSSYVLAGALPRLQFGMVQSKVYPVYFRLLAYSVMVVLAGHLYGQRNNLLSKTAGMAQVYSLLWTFSMMLFNLLYLEPRVTQVMFWRMKMGKEEGRGRQSLVSELTAKVSDDHMFATSAIPTTAAAPVTAGGMTPPPSRTQERNECRDDAAMSQIIKLSDMLKKLNAFSSFLNILTLMALTWHLVYLGQCLHIAC